MRFYIFLLIVLLSPISQALSQAPLKDTVLILSAMSSEQKAILHEMKTIHKQHYQDITYYTGMLNHRSVLTVVTGVGKASAAIVSSLFLSHFHPRAVIFSGVAGALQPKLNVGDVIIAKRLFDTNFGQLTKSGPVFLTGLPIYPIRHQRPPLIYTFDDVINRYNIKKKLKSLKKIHVYYGTLATDEHFPNNFKVDKLLKQLGVKAVAMEDSALALSCWYFRTPLLIVRGMSDHIIEHVKYTPSNRDVAAKNAALVVKTLI
jgi:adenosylhomocysteine nucleosidase